MDKLNIFKSDLKFVWVLVTQALLTPQCTNLRDTCFSIECQGESEAQVLFGAKTWLGLNRMLTSCSHSK